MSLWLQGFNTVAGATAALVGLYMQRPESVPHLWHTSRDLTTRAAIEARNRARRLIGRRGTDQAVSPDGVGITVTLGTPTVTMSGFPFPSSGTVDERIDALLKLQTQTIGRLNKTNDRLDVEIADRKRSDEQVDRKYDTEIRTLRAEIAAAEQLETTRGASGFLVGVLGIVVGLLAGWLANWLIASIFAIVVTLGASVVVLRHGWHTVRPRTAG